MVPSAGLARLGGNPASANAAAPSPAHGESSPCSLRSTVLRRNLRKGKSVSRPCRSRCRCPPNGARCAWATRTPRPRRCHCRHGDRVGRRRAPCRHSAQAASWSSARGSKREGSAAIRLCRSSHASRQQQPVTPYP
jgi:hypothetical protein